MFIIYHYIIHNKQKNNKNDNNNEIELIFNDTKGMEYNITASQDNVFGQIVRKFLNSHKEINKEEVGGFLFNGNKIKMQKTLKENNIENQSKILMIYKKLK